MIPPALRVATRTDCGAHECETPGCKNMAPHNCRTCAVCKRPGDERRHPGRPGHTGGRGVSLLDRRTCDDGNGNLMCRMPGCMRKPFVLAGEQVTAAVQHSIRKHWSKAKSHKEFERQLEVTGLGG